MIDFLPFDVLSRIFSFLSRHDVLECMLVSQQWQELVPSYASDCFSHIVLRQSDYYQHYKRLLSQVREFVKVVDLEHYTLASTCHHTVSGIVPKLFPNMTTLSKW